MSKAVEHSLEALAAAAGVDLKPAVAGLHALDAAFGGEAGLIPDGALRRWVDEHFGHEVAYAIFVQFAKSLEAEVELPKDRAWERGPDAAQIKAQKNLEKMQKAKK